MGKKVGDYRSEDEARIEGARLYRAGLCDDYQVLYHHGLYALYIIVAALTDTAGGGIARSEPTDTPERRGEEGISHEKAEGGREMKTEREYGYEYAEAMRGERGFDNPVDIDAMVHGTVDIPEDDYHAMRDAGISNPDAREYWRGFNSFFNE